MIWRAAILLIIITASGNASARGGGHVQTFDPNLFGGGWWCFTAAVVGTCGTGFNAACDGVTDDTSAWNSFNTSATAASGPVKLYIPPGSKCTFPSGIVLGSVSGATSNDDGTPIKTLIVWAYGVTFGPGQVYLGASNSIHQNNTKTFYIQSANAGDTSLTLVTAGDAANFSAGQYIIVSALSMQRTGSYPPNWYFFEYDPITAVNGSVLTLGHALKYSYKSTYPKASQGSVSDTNLGGPAAAIILNVAWNQNLTIYGLRFTATGIPLYDQARTVALYDVICDDLDGIQPSVSETYSIFYSYMRSPEMDKLVDTFVASSSSAKQVIFQSQSFNNVTFDNFVADFFNGTSGKNLLLRNIRSQIRLGPLAFGYDQAVTIQDSSLPTTTFPYSWPYMDVTKVTFSSGTFTLPKTNPSTDFDQFFSWAVPGQKYYFSDNNGVDNSSPHTTFTVTNVREDVSNYYADTDIGGSLPTPTCNGHACPYYVGYQTTSVKQVNSGPTDYTPYQPH